MSERIRLQLDPLPLLAGTADDRGARGRLEQVTLKLLDLDIGPVQAPVADLMPEGEVEPAEG
jgi:hypothetical protein